VTGQRPEADDERKPQGPVGAPKDTVTPQQAQHDAQAASQKVERLRAQREPMAQSIRRLGQAYHFVDLERGVRRNAQLIAAGLHDQMDTIRRVAQHESLAQSGLHRIDKAERVVPKMQATIEFVSSYVSQQVRQLDLTPAASFAMHARLIPAFYLE